MESDTEQKCLLMISLALLSKPVPDLVLGLGLLSMAVFLIKPILVQGFRFKALYKNTKVG